MKSLSFLGRILVTALSALILANIIPGVDIKDSLSAVILALVLALLNTFIKPILVVLTIPITIITLGLFLLVINIIIIKLSTYLVPGFTVSGWVAALLFSISLSLLISLFESLIGVDKNKEHI